MDGDVTFRVEWSTLNYKDGLAITGKAPVVRRFPMIPGIDGAGTVETSAHPEWTPGDKVILNGWGCGESHLGMYGAKARVNGDWNCGLYRNAVRAGARASWVNACERAGNRDRCCRRRGVGRGRATVEA